MKKILSFFKIDFILLLSFYAGNSISQSSVRIIYGKIYYQSRGSQYPASYKRIVIMPNNNRNLALAQDLYNLFEDTTIKKIRGAKSVLTSKDGSYEFQNVIAGKYIIRVTGMGGMVIKFDVASNNYARKKIPDMPADYYYKKLEEKKYIQAN
jgi:hypothetical protein